MFGLTNRNDRSRSTGIPGGSSCWFRSICDGDWTQPSMPV